MKEPPKRRHIKFTIDLPMDIRQKIRMLAASQGISSAELVRDWIMAILNAGTTPKRL